MIYHLYLKSATPVDSNIKYACVTTLLDIYMFLEKNMAEFKIKKLE